VPLCIRTCMDFISTSQPVEGRGGRDGKACEQQTAPLPLPKSPSREAVKGEIKQVNKKKKDTLTLYVER
jgi:hypothetical protein